MKLIKSTICSKCVQDSMTLNGRCSKFQRTSGEGGVMKYRMYLSEDPWLQFRECAVLHKQFKCSCYFEVLHQAQYFWLVTGFWWFILGVISSLFINIWREDRALFQRFPVTGLETVGTNWNTGGAVWTSGEIFSLSGWLRADTCCTDQLWNLPLRRYLKGHGLGQLHVHGGCTRWPP